MKVRVLRAFLQGGARQEPGSVIELPEGQARELIHMGKAEAAATLPPVSGPLTTQSVAELVPGTAARRGRSKDAS